MKIKLRDYQKEASKLALRIKKCLLCMRVGCGKTMITLVTSNILLKYKKVNKVVIACTKTSVVAYQQDFEKWLNTTPRIVEKYEDYLDFLKSGTPICIIKHSFFNKLGESVKNLKELRLISKHNDLHTLLIVDEAHKISNPDSVTHKFYDVVRFLFERVILATATPYSSCLTQLYGLIHLIRTNIWKNLNDFKDHHVDEITIRKCGKVVRKEITKYKNLKELRARIEPFTYFFFPPTNLNHIEHKVKLKDYSVYYQMCQGLLTEEELEKFKEVKKLKDENK